ncbi:MAG: beta-mannanase [Lachnospiraceae bacterium]|nr:beta-mannanase [Lachnospiraceae bacterium]
MRKRGLRGLAVCMALAVTVSSTGVGSSMVNLRVSAKQVPVLPERGAGALEFEKQTSNEVAFGAAEDWDNTMVVAFNGDGKAIAAGSGFSFTMTISEAAYNTMNEEDYIKLEADFFQEENNWDSLVKLGWPVYKAADFTKNADGTYSVQAVMKFDGACGVFHSLQIRGVGTGFAGTVTFSGISLERAEQVEQYVDITEKVKEKGDVADLSNMASSVKLADGNAVDGAKALAAYLKGLQKNGQVLFGHQNSTFRSVRDDGKTSDIKDITGSEAGLFGIDTLALAGCETGKSARQEALDASVEASIKAYNGGSIISLSCHMPNFTNSKITPTGDEKYPYDFTKCDFIESQDLTPCADYVLEGGKYNPQFNAYLDIIADYALELQKENIPVLFRPFHENSGGWFWWGTSTSVESYQAMWRYMVHYLEDKGVHNFLYVYSPNGPVASEEEYLERFPGDAYVDVLGFDYYDDYSDVNVYTGDNFFDALATSCDVVAGLAEKKNKIPAISEAGIRVTGAGKDSLMVSGNPVKGKDWYNNLINTAAAHKIPYFLLWANFGEGNFFVPYKVSDTQGQELINEFISAYNNQKSIFGNGTNFYTTGDSAVADGALSKAADVVLSGYSTEVNGYMISPKNYEVIKEPRKFEAYVTNAEKAEFQIKAKEGAEAVVVPAQKEGNYYTASLTKEMLGQVGKTSTGIVTLVADGKELGSAKFINFNKDVDVLAKGMFDNFEYYYGDDALLQSVYGSHNSAANCSSSFSLDSTEKVEGDYSGAFEYTLSYKGSEVWTGGLGRVFDTDKTNLSEYNAVSMWVKPDGNGQKMVVQLNDGSAEYEAYLTEFVKGTKAQYVTIPFSSFIKKGDTVSINPESITSFKFWCNSVPENYTGQKDADGNYTVSGTILFDDIRAVKISDTDLAKADANGLIITDEVIAGSGEESPVVTPDPVKVTAPKKASLTSVNQKAKTKKVVVKWKKVSGATGYKVYMKMGKKGKYKLVKMLKKNSMVSYTTAELKSKKTYYFKVRAYKTESGKTVNGKYSAVKRVVVK